MGRESSISAHIGHFCVYIELNQLSLVTRTHCTSAVSCNENALYSAFSLQETADSAQYIHKSGLYGLKWKTRDPYSLLNDSLITRTHCTCSNVCRLFPFFLSVRRVRFCHRLSHCVAGINHHKRVRCSLQAVANSTESFSFVSNPPFC